MRNVRPPFKFIFDRLVTKGRQHLNGRVDGVQINLPFVSFTFQPDDTEQRVAREIVVRMADRRVLNAWECCDHCIDEALASLREIRDQLVDKQVALAPKPEGALYLVIEFMLEGIRQFLTFEQRLRDRPQGPLLWVPPSSDFRRPPNERETYFAALEMLRAHLFRCLTQVAAIAQVSIPDISEQMRYDDAWQLEAYNDPGVRRLQ